MTTEKLEIPKRTWLALKALAEKRGHTISETLRHAVNTEVYMDTRLSEGRTILCQDHGGETYKVIFTHLQ